MFDKLFFPFVPLFSLPSLQGVFASYDTDKNGTLDDEELLLFARDCLALVRKENGETGASTDLIKIAFDGDQMILSEEGFFSFLIEQMHSTHSGPISWDAFKTFCNNNPLVQSGEIGASLVPKMEGMKPLNFRPAVCDVARSAGRASSLKPGQVCFAFEDGSRVGNVALLPSFYLDVSDSDTGRQCKETVVSQAKKLWPEWGGRTVELSSRRAPLGDDETLKQRGIKPGSPFAVVMVKIIEEPPAPSFCLNVGTPFSKLPNLIIKFGRDEDLDKITIGDILERAKRAFQGPDG